MLPPLDIKQIYQSFDSPVTSFDCGQKCAPHHPKGIPFCCDICQAVPAAYRQEWDYLQTRSDLWHIWQGNECAEEPCDPADLQAETPESMLLLACKGPAACERHFRTISCRQFPFFPYITSDDRFTGLAYHWDFEETCWVISHLAAVSQTYRHEFVRLYDEIFALWEEDFDAYAATSEDLRDYFAAQKRRFPLLHRNGGYYLVSPGSERKQAVTPDRFRRFGPYRHERPAGK